MSGQLSPANSTIRRKGNCSLTLLSAAVTHPSHRRNLVFEPRSNLQHKTLDTSAQHWPFTSHTYKQASHLFTSAGCPAGRLLRQSGGTLPQLVLPMFYSFPSVGCSPVSSSMSMNWHQKDPRPAPPSASPKPPKGLCIPLQQEGRPQPFLMYFSIMSDTKKPPLLMGHAPGDLRVLGPQAGQNVRGGFHGGLHPPHCKEGEREGGRDNVG